MGVTGLALMLSPVIMAHGPTPQKIVETVEIAVPVERVWALAGDFGGLAQWNSALKSSESSNGNQPGARRTLVFANGETLHEDLDAYDAEKHEYQYRMSEPNVKAIPASSYSVIFRVTPTEKGTQVEWKSRAYRGDTSNEPPETLSDESVSAALQKFFSTGLSELKTKLEAKP
jgi:mxaD protein